MSTLRCDNFGPSAGGTTYSARGIAKAWVNFNGTGTIATRDSENVSSLTDNGTGIYTTNFASSFANANYSVPQGGRSLALLTIVAGPVTVAPTVSAFRVVTQNTGSTIDTEYVYLTVHGDLA